MIQFMSYLTAAPHFHFSQGLALSEKKKKRFSFFFFFTLDAFWINHRCAVLFLKTVCDRVI